MSATDTYNKEITKDLNYLCIAALIWNLPRDLVRTYRMLDRSLTKSEESPYKSQGNRNTEPKCE